MTLFSTIQLFWLLFWVLLFETYLQNNFAESIKFQAWYNFSRSADLSCVASNEPKTLESFFIFSSLCFDLTLDALVRASIEMKMNQSLKMFFLDSVSSEWSIWSNLDISLLANISLSSSLLRLSGLCEYLSKNTVLWFLCYWCLQ